MASTPWGTAPSELTIGGEDDGYAWLASAQRMSLSLMRGLRLWPGVRRAGPKAKPAADVGPAAPQAPRLICTAAMIVRLVEGELLVPPQAPPEEAPQR